MFKSNSAFKASFDTGTATFFPVSSSIAFANLSINAVTSVVSAAFSGAAVVLSATFEAASFALSKAVFLSWSAVLYLSEFLTFSASATNFCRESILESKPCAIETIPSISFLSDAFSTFAFNSSFWALFKWGKSSIVCFAFSREAWALASFKMFSNWSFDFAWSICCLYSALSASDNPGIWSICFLYSSFNFSASSWAFWASFLDFCFSASSKTFSTSATVVFPSICVLYSSAVGFFRESLIWSIFSFVDFLAFSKFLASTCWPILSSNSFV